MADHTPNEFERAAQEQGVGSQSLAAELWTFLARNKKWWLLPILIVMLLLGVLIMLSTGGATPFIYTFF